MGSHLPLIVGYGGFNSAGRSSGDQAYRRIIFESLASGDRRLLVESLAALMKMSHADEAAVLSNTLIRRISNAFFDVDHTPVTKRLTIKQNEGSAQGAFCIAERDLPQSVPANWELSPLDEARGYFSVKVLEDQTILVPSGATMPVQAAGQLPSGFEPREHYRSLHHPRGLQLTVLGASDAIHSMGISWSDVLDKISPEEVAVHSSSVMSQLDFLGLGGMMHARHQSARVTSKQLPLGLNTMPADFINAYLIGNVGSTGALTGACATFLYNLRQGVDDIKSGRRKVAIVGSSEAPVIPEIIDGYAAMSALATDSDLAKLDGLKALSDEHYRRASRPFGNNCGFTLAESSQYVVLMCDELAMELGAQIFAAVPGVFVNADGYKKSISAPGAGNYITLARAVGLAKRLVGDDVVRHKSFVQAHGSSTPQNRVTESKIFHRVAECFGIEKWPVSAIKSYVGHSLGPASGDQLCASLGVFRHGILPGIKTIDKVADDVHAERLSISIADQNLGVENSQVAFLNSKGFGGNNASATVISPSLVMRYLDKKYSTKQMKAHRGLQARTEQQAHDYLAQADAGQLKPIYHFGENIIDEEKIELTPEEITLPGYKNAIRLDGDEGFGDF